MNKPERGPLLEELRSATRAQHGTLDRGLSLRAETITVARYTAFLKGLLLVVEPLEERLSSVRGSPLRRAAALRADLAELGEGEPIAMAPELPRLENAAAAQGARYVLEGSSLGSAVLAREIGRGLQLEGRALRYLTLHGDRVGEHWKSEVAALERWGQTATLAERAECCKAARAVFTAFTLALRSTAALPEVA